MEIMRSKYPRPQFEREKWINLNGEWQFEIDNAKSGEERLLYKTEIALSDKINVPFCPESKLSGICNTDFMSCVWYKRFVDITEEMLEQRIIIHFGAVDYYTKLYINGALIGEHKGGYSSFEFDITDNLNIGENQICVCAYDEIRSPLIPRGKQSEKYYSQGCDYTRTTGIWQTVWLELRPINYIKNVKYFTDINEGSVRLEVELNGKGCLKTVVKYKDRVVGEKELISLGGNESLTIKLSELHLWELGNGRLYDVYFSFGKDNVKSYFGMRSIKLDGMRFLLNGRAVFQRLILDQGFYPDGIYTAPDDDDLLGDIKISMAMGFNGARLHEKVFEERYLYYCDKMGYMVWGEYPNWGLDHSANEALTNVLPEWLEILKRDFNHPSIIGWCPYNETWDYCNKKQSDVLISSVYDVTKAIDPTRPCIDTSGHYHVKTDIFDLHDYEQNPIIFSEHYADFAVGGSFFDDKSARQHYKGEPVFISEYGGILWAENESDCWGYGDAPKTKDEFLERFKNLADVILDNPRIFGFCYTQLTDVEQEQNGLYTYNREAKFETETIRKIISRTAAIELT